MNQARPITERLSHASSTIRAIDWATSISLRAASPPYRVFTRLGAGRLPKSTNSLREMGIFPIRNHYYQPLFDDALLRKPLSEVRSLPGIQWRHEEQVELLGRLKNYSRELRARDMFDEASGDLGFHLNKGSFGSGDAEFLYAMIRHLKPKRIIEIGSGSSTKIAQMAIRRNNNELGTESEHTCIEPYEMPWLEQLGVQVIRRRVEDVGIEFFLRLEANDLLFIDSSHIIRPQGDVLFEYLELLPALASGVVVHVHDIFSPRDYPDDWVRNHVLMWNEQYILEALLSHSTRYDILAALNYLRHSEYDLLTEVCPYLTVEREPGSFYVKVR